MSDRTGRKMGTLEPIVYYQNAKGDICLPPTTETGRYFYEKHYRHLGWEYREASTLSEVDELQKRLVAIEERKTEKILQNHDERRHYAKKATASALHQRLCSSSTSEYEKDYIRAWLDLQSQEKRDKYRQSLEQRNTFLWIREMDSSNKATDLIA